MPLCSGPSLGGGATEALVAKMSSEAQERAKARTREMWLEMNLQELRQRCAELTQEEVAGLLDVTQAFVSKFERRDDVLLSTLYGYIQALGGVRPRPPSNATRRSTDAPADLNPFLHEARSSALHIRFPHCAAQGRHVWAA